MAVTTNAPVWRWYDVSITGSNDAFPSVRETVRVRAPSASKAATTARRAWTDENCRAGTKGLTFRSRISDNEER